MEPFGHMIRSLKVTPDRLGSTSFRKDYGVRYSYASGSMYKGIGSKEIVIRMGKAGLLVFLGTAGMRLVEVEANLKVIQSELSAGEAYGILLTPVVWLLKAILPKKSISKFIVVRLKGLSINGSRQRISIIGALFTDQFIIAMNFRKRQTHFGSRGELLCWEERVIDSNPN